MGSVGEILKGMGRKVKDTFPSKGSPNLKGPFQRLTNRSLEHPDFLTHAVVPYHLANKYSVPLAGGIALAPMVAGGMALNNRNMLGEVSPGEGLSGMTDGGIAGASANVISPRLKALNDNTTQEARAESAMVRNNMQGNISTRGAEGDIVFALHNMR